VARRRYAVVRRNNKMPFINSNETKLYYKEFGTGNPILVLHGGPGVDHKYMLNLKALAKYYRLIFVD
jgi:proline iminopeptidase